MNRPEDQNTVPQEKQETTASNSLWNNMQAFLATVWQRLALLWKWTAYAIGSLILGLIIIIIIASIFSGTSRDPALAREQHVSGSGLDKVVVLPIEGIIGEAGSSVLGGGVGISAELIHANLTQAQNDPLVKAVILSINSPGGSAVISDHIYQHIVDFKRDSKKPVIASFGDTAASGGYYIAAAADKIVANPASLTGSIGVIMEYYDASGLMQNIGVSPEVIKSGNYKDIGSLTRPTTDEERAILQSVVDDAYEQFIDRVEEGRNMDRDAIVALADGRIYTGAQAKENGLIDEVGNLSKAVELAKDFADIDQVTVVKYVNGSWLDSMLGVNQLLQPLSAFNRLTSSYSVSGLQYRWSP